MLKNKDVVPSKIVGIQFGILSPQEILNQSVAEIKTRDTYINNKPVIGGLFDPRMAVFHISGLLVHIVLDDINSVFNLANDDVKPL